MRFDLETLFWVQKNCCDGCKFNIKDGTPMALASSIQFNVMHNGANGRDPECDKKEKGMSEEELKPCPFCGRQEAYFSYDSRNNLRVYCPCGVQSSPGYNTKDAREAWNTRHEDRNCR